MRTNLVIIDDFYDHPDIVRDYALSLEYPEPHEGYTYPGRNSKGGIYNGEIHARIENRLGEKLKYPSSIYEAGYFRYSPETSGFQQDIHVDPIWDVGGVLYLNEHADPESGTSFWYHNELKIERVPTNPKEGAKYGFDTYEDIRKNIIYGDGLDRSKWTRYAFAPYKFNRLVLFDSKLWHSHGNNFGSTKEDSRLVQLFFFSISQ